MNQSAASQPSRKKAVFSLLTLLALTCVIVLIFRDHWAEITAALAQLNLWQVLVVLALGISYPLLADKARCVQIFALQALKLFLLFCLPWLCIRFMQLSPLSFARVQLLTSLMLFVSNALPNVAGMGSIETAFLLLYSSFLPSGEVMSVLMLYRIASYYFVFAASAVGFFLAQRRLTRTPPKED